MNPMNCEYNYMIQYSGIMNTKVSKSWFLIFKSFPENQSSYFYLYVNIQIGTPDICMYIYALPFPQRFNLCQF